MTFVQNIICNCKLVVAIVNNTDWIILSQKKQQL